LTTPHFQTKNRGQKVKGKYVKFLKNLWRCLLLDAGYSMLNAGAKWKSAYGGLDARYWYFELLWIERCDLVDLP